MAYIDKDFYTEMFGGTEIPDNEFKRLAQTASDVIDGVVVIEFEFDELDEKQQQLVMKATAYQIEMIYCQGGIDAIVGLSAQDISSEQLGDYHVSKGSASVVSAKANSAPTLGGIAVSPIAVSLLRKAGLMNRWAYHDYYEKHHPPYSRG